jgi:hypothetical protein
MNFLRLRGSELVNLDAISRIVVTNDALGHGPRYEVYFIGATAPKFYSGADALALARVLPGSPETTAPPRGQPLPYPLDDETDAP